MPLAASQIDPPSPIAGIAVRLRRYERHTLGLQQRTLRVRPTEREPRRQRTITEHHAVAWDHTLLRIAMQRIPHQPRAARRPDQRRDLPIRGDHAPRNPTHHRIHTLVERLVFSHTPIMLTAVGNPTFQVTR